MSNLTPQERESAAGGAWAFGSLCITVASIVVGALTYSFAGAIVGGLLACGLASFVYIALFGPRRPE